MDEAKKSLVVREVVSVGAGAAGGALIYKVMYDHFPLLVEWVGKTLASWLKKVPDADDDSSR